VLLLLWVLRQEHVTQGDAHVPIVVTIWGLGSLDLSFLMHIVPDIIGGIIIALVGERVLRTFKQNRKDALFDIIFRNVESSFPLLERLSTFTLLGGRKSNLKCEDYKTLLQLIYYANQRVKRSIDLNETVATDTFLNVDEAETYALVRTNDAAYELSAILEYVSERLGNRDYFALGYEGADTSKIEGMFETLRDDLNRLNYVKWLERYIRSYRDVFAYLNAKGQNAMRHYYRGFLNLERSVPSEKIRFEDAHFSLHDRAKDLFQLPNGSEIERPPSRRF
jgi:uncharacterized protein YutD